MSARRTLRLAVLADFEGPHARRWLRYFVERGHEVHAISFYRPRAEMPGVTLHVLRDVPPPSSQPAEAAEGMRALAARLPPEALRLTHAVRYLRAGLRGVLRRIDPDVFHAHYVVEHGFYGSLASFHPYVVSGWGSDVFLAANRLDSRLLARWTLARADLLTANDAAMVSRLADMGASGKVELVRLGVDDLFLSDEPPSVNLDAGDTGPPVLISTRAHEPLYNVDQVVRAFARLRREVAPAARLVVAHEGSESARLRSLASALGDAVRFTGRLDSADLRNELARAHVYVSVPDSDSLAVSTMEAMAAGCFPIVSDLPSQRDFIEDGVTGLLVPAGDRQALAAAMARAIADRDLRRRAAQLNRLRIEKEGRLETNMAKMEEAYGALVTSNR